MGKLAWVLVWAGTIACADIPELIAAVPNPVCRVSTSTWQNITIPEQTDSAFTVEFDALPYSGAIDGVVGLSNGWTAKYASQAASIRFNLDGKIDARNKNDYAATTVIPYSDSVSYHFRLVVSLGGKTYSAFVKVGSGSEQTVANNYQFRTEQAKISKINTISLRTAVGSLSTCYGADSVVIPPPDTTTPPAAPTITSLTVTPATASLATHDTKQFTAAAVWSDAATRPFTTTWVATGGTSDTSGLYTAGASAGSFRIIGSSGGKADTSTITVTAPDTTAPVSNGCPTSGYVRLVNVSTASGLTSAINAAVAGDQIRLAAGTYSGHWTITRNGTSAHPITVCGPRSAIIDNTDLSSTSLYLNGADYWVTKGITIRDGIAGWAAKNGANWNTLDSVDVGLQGQANVVVKAGSKHNTIKNNQIHGGGRSNAQFGECVYIGTTESQWGSTGPDHSDSNSVLNNNIYDCTADGVQFMAGTTGTLVRRNTIDGLKMVAITGAPPHWVLAMGNSSRVDSNTATNALTYGMKVRRSTTASSWGSNIIFKANQMTMSSRASTYYGIYLETQPAQGMIVYCDNHRTEGDTKRSNVTCTP